MDVPGVFMRDADSRSHLFLNRTDYRHVRWQEWMEKCEWYQRFQMKNERCETFSHPTGRRAHLMNVYTKPDYRRKGISKKMVEMIIDEAKENGVTEISLDATEMGRTLYETLGFTASNECMVMEL